MQLEEILKQPDGFTPPELTVTIEKVYAYKSGESDRGAWSFQDIQVTGGKLKLKGLPEFPQSRVGQTVTLKAHSSKQHGLTGLKVNHEQYQGNTYDKIVITGSAKWQWHENGTKPELTTTRDTPARERFDLETHLVACAGIASRIAAQLSLNDDSARQACFATVCIDAQRHNVLLGTESPKPEESGDPRRDALLRGVTSACKLLNDEGLTPPMTPAALNEYVNVEFEIKGGIESLTTSNVETLIQKLSDKLDTFRANKDLGESEDDGEWHDDKPRF